MCSNAYFRPLLNSLAMQRTALPDAPAPHEAHAHLAAVHATTFILESRDGPERLARYSFVGFAPAATITYDATGLHVDGALPDPGPDPDPLAYLRLIQAEHAAEDHDAPFVGGLVGAIGYDFVRHLEPTLDVPRGGAGDPGSAVEEPWPRFRFGLYLDGLVYDHRRETCHYVSRDDDRSSLVEAALSQEGPTPRLQVGSLRASMDDPTFVEQARKAQHLIRSGECFQIVLSRAFTAPYQGDLHAVYGRLRDAAAVPYLYHLRDDAHELLGASPESLVRVRRGRVDTFPIAGTRPLTGDAPTDEEAGQDLLRDRKETAEHAMLVDLARNDLSRVCSPGSVQVTEYQGLHRFRTVQHLVSRVEGQLAEGYDALDALAAVFPAGTVSGAPKVRAMEHIDALESTPRGPYAGAVAYLSFNGDFDAAIAIRSLSATDGTLTVQAGAGVVHRSDPEAEAEETLHKAATMLDALAPFQAPDRTRPTEGPL